MSAWVLQRVLGGTGSAVNTDHLRNEGLTMSCIYCSLFLEWVFPTNLCHLHSFLYVLNSYWSCMTQAARPYLHEPSEGGLLRAPSGSQSSWWAIHSTGPCWLAWFVCQLYSLSQESGGVEPIFYSSLYLWGLAASARVHWIFTKVPFLACTLRLGFNVTASESFYLFIHVFTHSFIYIYMYIYKINTHTHTKLTFIAHPKN